MDTGAILIGFAVLVLSIPWLARPFARKRQWEMAWTRDPAHPEQDQNLYERRQNILLALRDLDFDYQIGKIAEDDHQALRVQLLAEAANLAPDDEDDEIEALIRARREVLAKTKQCSQCAGRLGAQDRFCPQCGAPAGKEAGAFCPDCRSKNVPEARFCSRCGKGLASQEAPLSN